MKKGLIHVYCGDGKGKTTAAIGLALRAAGSGMKVVILQFLKGRDVSELNTLTLIPGISVLRNSIDYGFYNTMDEQVKQDIKKLHNDNLISVIDLINKKQCDMLILDELTATYEYGLIDKNVVENLIRNKPAELELVITGRNPDNLFIEHADYISEIRKIKHPYDKGVVARRGIES